MSVQYASIGHDKVFLFTERGEAMARRYFGDEVVNALPKFGPRSKHNGKPKGMMTFRRVIAGGWVRMEQRVERRVGQIITAELHDMPRYGQSYEGTKVLAVWSADAMAMRQHMITQEQRELQLRADAFRSMLDMTTIQAWCLYKIDQQRRLAAQEISNG